MKELRRYESFESVTELNDYIHEVLTLFDLRKTERELIWLLSGHSVKVLGVSWLKVQTMADTLGVSYKTAQRALRRLRELGIIQRVEQFKPKSGGHSSFLTVFCPSVLSYSSQEETPEEARDELAQGGTETITSKAKPLKELKYVEELDYTYLENSIVPEGFIRACKPFYSSAKEIHSLWSKALSVASRVAPEVDDITDTAISAFKQSIFALKSGKIRGAFKGYYWGALKNMLTVEMRRLTVSKGGLIGWNWLES